MGSRMISRTRFIMIILEDVSCVFCVHPQEAGPREPGSGRQTCMPSRLAAQTFLDPPMGACHFRGMRLDPNPGHRDLAESVCMPTMCQAALPTCTALAWNMAYLGDSRGSL